MRTEQRHPTGVQKRLCVSVYWGKLSIYFSKIIKYFVFFGYFVKEIVIVNSVFGFVVLNSIWWHGLKVSFDIYSKIFKKCPRSVNNFRMAHLGIVLGFLVPLRR